MSTSKSFCVVNVGYSSIEKTPETARIRRITAERNIIVILSKVDVYVGTCLYTTYQRSAGHLKFCPATAPAPPVN